MSSNIASRVPMEMVYERFDVAQHFCCCVRLISVIVLGCQSSLSTCTSVVGRGLGMLFP